MARTETNKTTQNYAEHQDAKDIQTNPVCVCFSVQPPKYKIVNKIYKVRALLYYNLNYKHIWIFTSHVHNVMQYISGLVRIEY